MSVYNKYLWQIVVPTGDWDFGFNYGGARVATIPAGTYDTILELCAELEDQLDALALGVDWEVVVSQYGRVVIGADDGWTWTTATTDDDLSLCLGLDEASDTVGSINAEDLAIFTAIGHPGITDTLRGSSQHLHGYYPGTYSWGWDANRGTGTINTRYWRPNWPMVRSVAGDHTTRTVGPATATQRMDLQYGLIKSTEAMENTIGLRAFIDECVAIQFRLYPDRALGQVDAEGTQDSKTLATNQPEDDYWLCCFAQDGDPRVRDAQSPGYMTFSLALNREP